MFDHYTGTLRVRVSSTRGSFPPCIQAI